MNSIKFTAIVQGKRSDVEISAPNGAGGSFFLMVDNYYRGSFIKRPKGWEYTGSVLTQDQIDGAIKYIEKHFLKA